MLYRPKMQSWIKLKLLFTLFRINFIQLENFQIYGWWDITQVLFFHFFLKATICNMQQNTLCEQIGIRDIKIQRVILQRWLNRTLSKMAMRADTNFLVTIFSVKGLRHKDMPLYIQRWGNRSERGRGAILHSIAIRHAWSSITRAWLWAHRKWLVLHTFAFSHSVAHKYESKFWHPP